MMTMELEMLESVFPPEDRMLEVRKEADVLTVTARLRPYTAEVEAKQFVRLNLSLKVLCCPNDVSMGCYPNEPPIIELGRSSGLDDD